jgi:uncharacterized SAM-binding protein YcdF (DUF218 family)
VYFLVNVALVVQTAREHQQYHTDAIVVMGAAEFNGVPSKVFAARIRSAEALYRQHVAPLVITVGGHETGDRFSEAEVGRDVLLRDGIGSADVDASDTGDDTYDSLSAILPLIVRDHLTSVTVVSDGFHLYRSMSILRGFGLRAYGYADQGSPIHGLLNAEYILREGVAVSVARVIGYQEESSLRHG